MARPVGSKGSDAIKLRNTIIASFTDDRVGGIEYLVKQAHENPVAYMGLIGKVLPKEVNLGGQEDNPVHYSLKPDDYKILASLGVQINEPVS